MKFIFWVLTIALAALDYATDTHDSQRSTQVLRFIWCLLRHNLTESLYVGLDPGNTLTLLPPPMSDEMREDTQRVITRCYLSIARELGLSIIWGMIAEDVVYHTTPITDGQYIMLNIAPYAKTFIQEGEFRQAQHKNETLARSQYTDAYEIYIGYDNDCASNKRFGQWSNDY